jgi:hypothetical protein
MPAVDAKPPRTVNRALMAVRYRGSCRFTGMGSLVMKALLGFLSLVALGLIAAVVIVLAMTGGGDGLVARRIFEDGFRLDYPSLLLGLVLGLVMATIARISWAELPRRIVLWLVANERNFYRVATAAIMVGVILFY